MEEGDIFTGFKEPEEEAPVVNLNPQAAQGPSRALAMWLLHFLLFVQAVFHISDNALTYFIKFFKVFFSVLGRYCKISAEIAECLPSSLYQAKSYIDTPKFRKYVVCKKCHRIYFFSDCVEGPRTAHISKTCPFQNFPMHPHERMRMPCGTILLKSVELASGVTYLYPRLTYCYLGLEVSLQHLLLRRDFYKDCELWRSRQTDEGMLRDIYDGKIWSEFQPFLSEPGNFAVMLNMDFFQPYKHVQYSLGAIYLTILNLPRGTRNKSNNVILVGLIPGPHEPQHDINSFLEPLVNDLQQFWTGIELNVHSLNCKKKIRCALVCIACDLPAGRKTCGFLNYNARFGCSRCWKQFSGGVGSMDYSGFDRENWRQRTGPEHKQLACRLLSKKTKSDRNVAESQSGCRYSVLLELPYFDAPRMLIIDPMHNLFLGSAKHFLKSILIGREIISESQFHVLQQRVDSMCVPPDIGRIPYKIRSGFSSFNADQWKNWVVYFSLIAMHDVLSNDILECWRHFVQACRVLSTKQISLENIQLGDAHLIQFCKRTQRLFGKESITPNMHMHCHLRSCIIDFGPLHGFWLYAFERYNGLLGAMPHNNHSIEVQIMNRFLRDNEVFRTVLPDEFSDEFQSLFPKHMHASGSLADTLTLDRPFRGTGWTIDSPGLHVDLPLNCSRRVFDQTQMDFFMELYTDLYKVSRSSLVLSSTFQEYSSAKLNGKQFGTYRTRTASSSVAIAVWDSNLFGPSPMMSTTSTSTTVCRAVRIHSFCKHVVTIDGETKTHLLVSLSWFRIHPKHGEFGKPTTVWYSDFFESFGIYSIIPVQLLQSRTVSIIDRLNEESVIFVCPCIDS